MSRVFSGFFNTVSMEFQASFKGGLEGLNELSGVFHGNLKGVQRKVHAFLARAPEVPRSMSRFVCLSVCNKFLGF